MSEYQERKVLIVEDDQIISSCLQKDLDNAQGLCVTGAVDSLREAKKFALNDYQIVLLDLNLTDGHGLEFIEYLNGYPHRPKILVLSVLGDEATVLKAIESGADGYLLKGAAPKEIITSINTILDGDSASSPPIVKMLMQRVRSQGSSAALIAPEAAKNPLSPRELVVLELLAQGNSYQQIASHMGITYNTVAHYTKTLYAKLGVGSKNQAIYKGICDGIISI